MWLSEELAKPDPSEQADPSHCCFEVTVANADFHKCYQPSKKRLMMLTTTNTHFVGKCCALDTVRTPLWNEPEVLLENGCRAEGTGLEVLLEQHLLSTYYIWLSELWSLCQGNQVVVEAED